MFRWLLIVYILFAAPASSRTVDPVFQILAAPGDAGWVNHALSHDGDTIAVNAGGHYYLWTRDGGYRDLGPSHVLTSTVGISGDGRVVCGTILDRANQGAPAVWKRETGWQPLGSVHGGKAIDGRLGSGYDPNHDGSVAVGLAWTASGAAAFRWTAATGALKLPDSGLGSRATETADQADVVVGFDQHPRTGHRRPARWTGGRLELVAASDQTGEILAVSSDGARSCGQLDGRAFYLDESTGLVDIGVLGDSAWDRSLASDVTDNGVVVGWSGDPSWGELEAFVWTSRAGIRPVTAWLTGLGVAIPADLTLTGALEISADGTTLLGGWQDRDRVQGTWLVTGLDAADYETLPATAALPDTSWQKNVDRHAWPPPPSTPGRPIRMR